MEERAAMNPEFAWQLKWWAFGGRFPLKPILRVKKGNQWNTPGFHFHWLGLRVWSMDSVDIGVEVNLSDTDLSLRFRVPYIIAGFWLPVMPMRFSQRLWRRPNPEHRSDT